MLKKHGISSVKHAPTGLTKGSDNIRHLMETETSGNRQAHNCIKIVSDPDTFTPLWVSTLSAFTTPSSTIME